MADCDARVLDFLDDKLQTPADLASLDALVAHVAAQHDVLQQQLSQAQRDLLLANDAATSHHDSLAARAAAFARDQHDIDRRLLVVTASDTTDDAVPRFEAVTGTLHRLDVASAYLTLLADVDALHARALTALDTSAADALEPYRQLRALHARLAALHHSAEGAAPQLLHHVDALTRALHARIRDALAVHLEALLKQIHWPTPKATVPAHLHDAWETAMARLLDLQTPDLLHAPTYAAAPGSRIALPPVLLPLDVLVQPLAMRFRYHFDGDKPTNRIDRPEYFLAHVTSLLDDYAPFVADYVQPVLLKQFRGTDLALNPVYIDATSAFITALLPMLRAKLASLLPQVAPEPQLLSHLMHELMTFDSTLRDTWGYDGGYGIDGWKGLAWELLVQGDWFGRWLRVEKDFALARYQSIVDAPDFGDLDYESVDPKATKPTKGAIRVNDLLETVTDRYRPLASFSQKLSFLIDIQIAIFDKLHERLQSNLEAYLSMTTSLGRAMGGVTKEEQDKLLGVDGLERLCKTYGSADYLEKAMRDWSDDVFFLDIWEDLQDRARDANSVGGRTVADVAERTSKAVGGDVDGGGLFDETASWYARLRERSEQIIIDTLTTNVREALRPYRHINPWATLSGGAAATLAPTAEIDPLLAYLGTTLGFLSRALAPAPLRRITRAVLATVSTVLWDNVLTRYRFSTAGAAQLHADLAAVCRVVEKQVGPRVAEAGLRRCLEAVQLVGLPVKGGKLPDAQPADAAAGDDDMADAWGAWDAADEPQKQTSRATTGADAGAGAGADADADADADASAIADADADATLGLWQVEQRLFADNQSARAVLDQLGVEVLTETEARALLRRRVELSG